MIFEKKRTSELLPADYNPRKDLKPGDAEYEKLKRSIEQFGYVEPVIWNKTTGRVVGGHQRLKVLMDLGFTEVDCVVVELPDEKEKALNVALNKISGDWDKDKLALLISDLQGADFDVSLTGFDPAEIDDLFKQSVKGGLHEDEFDVAAELEKPTITKPGDIWTLGRHRLICGDSTKLETFELLMAGRKANLVITDPPYNVNYEGSAGKIKNDNMTNDAFYQFLLSAFQNTEAVMADDASIYVFHADTEGLNFRRAFADAGFYLSGCCIWKKQSLVLGRSPYQWQHEPVLYGWKKNGKHQWYTGRKETTIWEFDKPKKNGDHPTMKPIALLAYPIMNSSMSNTLVLDPFGGSGSTLIACEQSDRSCFTIELDEKFCDVIVKRYIEQVGTAEQVSVVRDGLTYAYHLYDSGAIEIISEEDQQTLIDGSMPDSLMRALRHYLIGSAIMYKRGRMTSEMIIHAHRNVTQHHAIYRMVNSWLDSLKDSVAAGDPEDMHILHDEFESDYISLFTHELRDSFNFEELWSIIQKKILKRTYLILKNSAGQVTQANESLRKYKIYIGGDLLQRGVTFSNLVTTYFSRWAKDGGNMDTNLQRARWFGYREKWIDICKIFTSETIAREFTNLSEMETDLWEQFTSVQAGEMTIDEILIKADNTKQKPTRKNVATYTAVSFRNKWIKQRVGVFDNRQVDKNNAEVESFLSTLTFSDLKAGRRDGMPSAQAASVDRSMLTSLIDQMEVVFDLEPFEKKPLKDLIESSGKVNVILMKDNNGMGRQRSFYSNNKIYALQQGADNKDKEKAVFLGDSFVIANPNEINIQIYKIVPKKKIDGTVVVMPEFTQYMFAVYIPKEKVYFVKGLAL